MTWRIEHGDCLDVMRGMADASVDAIVSDPPYGLAFMGKQWDHGVPGVPFWTEALRVAKPGAHLLAFGGTRTFHRLAVAIEDAGWEVRDTIAWVQGQGFPKSHNLPGGLGTALKPAYEPVVVARKTLTPQQDLATLAPTTREALCAVDSFGKTGTPSSAWLRASGFWSTVESLKSALGVLSARASTFTTETAFAMTTDLRILNSCLSRIMRACTTEASSATSGIESVVATAEDFSRSVLHKYGRLASTTAGATAIALPAERAVVPADGDFDLEMSPIIVARKPLVGTVARNVSEFGTGALNVDGCRIGMSTADESRLTDWHGRYGGKDYAAGQVLGFNNGDAHRQVSPPHALGRWPANVMLDEELDHVLCLRDSELEPLFRSVYAGFDSVHSVWRPVGGAAVAAQAVAVLHTALLRRVVEREQIGREPPHAREAAQRGSDREDVESTEGARVGGSESEHMEGRPVQVARVHDAGGVCVVPGGPRIGGSDGGARSRVRAGTSAGDGTAAGAPTTGRGGCASPERAQIGQQTGESGVDGRGGAQAGSRFGGGGTSASTGDDRRPAFCVAESDVPAVWREYFVESGRLIRTGSAAMLDAQTGVSRSTATVGVVRRGRSGGIMGEPGAIRDGRPEGHSDSGGASRFFYVAKASRSEREAGLREAGLREAGIHRYGAGIGEGKTPDAPAIGRNTHPTVKPVALMRWLCRLVTPPGGVVLDPFCGSGTTGVAAVREGFRFVGIEREAEYVEIARARVAHAAQGQVSPPGTEAA